MSEFICVTSPEGNPIYIRKSGILAITVSEYPKCKTDIWLGAGPNDSFSCKEKVSEIKMLMREAE